MSKKRHINANLRSFSAKLSKLSDRGKSLQCVRQTVQAILLGFSDMSVRRNLLRLSATKNGIAYSVDSLSGGKNVPSLC